MAIRIVTSPRGFDLPCIHCGSREGLSVLLGDVQTLSCGSCENEVALDQLKEALNHWQRAVAWLDSAPTYLAQGELEPQAGAA